MNLDFLTQLSSEVKGLDLKFPLYVGLLDKEESLAIRSLPGGSTVREYYDGTKDKELNYHFSIKTKNQELAIETLMTLAEHLENVENIASKNNSYQFSKIKIVDEPFFVGETEDEFFYYQLTIKPNLTIFKEETKNG